MCWASCSTILRADAAVPPGRGGLFVPSEDSFTDDPEDADIVAQIRELIDTRVRPAVANDGGDIVYRGFDKGKVYLKMQGACAGCPLVHRDAEERYRAAAAPLCPRSHRSEGRLNEPDRRFEPRPAVPRGTDVQPLLDTPVGEDEIRAIWDLMKMPPTSTNQSPARMVWCLSAEAKEKLAACASDSNADKIRNAPAAVIIAHGREFPRNPAPAVPACGCQELVRGQYRVARGLRLPQQFAPGRLSDPRRACARAGYRRDVGLRPGRGGQGVLRRPAGRAVELHRDAGLRRYVPSCTRATPGWRSSKPIGSPEPNLRTLVIDTATAACSVALLDGDRVVAHGHDVVGRGHAERLVPMIAALPDGGRAARILVDCGPGSLPDSRRHRGGARAGAGLGRDRDRLSVAGAGRRRRVRRARRRRTDGRAGRRAWRGLRTVLRARSDHTLPPSPR